MKIRLISFGKDFLPSDLEWIELFHNFEIPRSPYWFNRAICPLFSGTCLPSILCQGLLDIDDQSI